MIYFDLISRLGLTRQRARLLLLALFFAGGCGSESEKPSGEKRAPTVPVAEWREFGGDKGGLTYSPLTQIGPANVGELEVAWEYRHGDISQGTADEAKTSFLATPLVADGTLYFCTAFSRVVALDPETGAERWSFDPELRSRASGGPYPLSCRGVAYWSGKEGSGENACQGRVYVGTRDSELIALDALTGEPCPDFGEGGRVALREGIGEAAVWEYYPTSPPLVIGDVVVIGALVADQLRVDAPSGVVRAFDLETGALRWAWDPVPPGFEGEEDDNPGGRYRAGTPNVWAPMSGDEERGLVFVPTGNPAPDSFGGQREGSDYYGSSTVALSAESGEVVWNYQFVHNDLWDYDTPAQPALFQRADVGEGRPALAQATKMGHIFLLDRETGEALYPVEERPVPQEGAVPEEKLSPTQPFPTHPPPIHTADLQVDDAWGFTLFDQAYCRDLIAGFRSQGIFTPPSLEGSLQYPGSAGGANWGGVSIDPVRGLLFVNQNHLPMAQQLIPRAEFAKLDPAAAVYPDELYPMAGTPYGLKRVSLLSNFGAPCVRPPWGSLTAVDLVEGEVLWTRALGTTRDQAPFPLWFGFGTPNAGGSMATASGLVFIGATTDKFLRAFSSQTGEEIWRARLPYTANATPITYRLSESGRQFVVIAAGGHGWSESGDAVVAYALPE
ncbi:MAG: pyrroloquinoline quinone-dependent dehydrogenase [Myxococcota bacterium]|nr:pyrroloquinoline quinone-dependent dehydrogenase [Myxococcota bacterium]